MTSIVGYSIKENIAFIIMNQPPVNGLGLAMRQALLASYRQASRENSVQAIVIGSASSVFCAGADISEFAAGRFGDDPFLPTILDEIEGSRKPVIAAINGAALGGGLELALACDYRFAHPKAEVGLPEVNLGIIPGAGGTQRLPRVTDPATATEMIATGKIITAAQAHSLGIVDVLFSVASNDSLGNDAFLEASLAYARQLLADQAPLRNCAEMAVDCSNLNDDFFSQFRQSIAHRSRGFFAPERCVQAVEFACHSTLQQGLKREKKLFDECQHTSQARAQQHLFFAERAAGKIPGVDASTPPRAINRVAIIGAGTMGGGIAMSVINAGIPVTLLEVSTEALEHGVGIIRSNYERSVSKGKHTAKQVEQRMGLLQTTLDYQQLSDVDMVIEAVFENMAIKQQVFKKLDAICKPGAILASNTSTLDVDQIAAVTSRPEDVIGLHFFSPANVMKLLEIVRGAKTANDVIVTAIKMGKTIGKMPVVAGVCWGFIGNRVLEPYGRESTRLVLEGASPAQIDHVLNHYGLAMGFLSMIDLAGIDVGYLTREGNQAAFEHDKSYQAICNKLYSLQRFGQKNGRGFYCYEGRDKTKDPEVITLAEEIAQSLGIPRREISDQEILERTLFMLINEGAQVLDEGIAYRASDIDLIFINGYGFPAWRGGPMQYADEIGLATVVKTIEHYRQKLSAYGEQWFTPSPLLTKLAAEGKCFKDYDARD